MGSSAMPVRERLLPPSTQLKDPLCDHVAAHAVVATELPAAENATTVTRARISRDGRRPPSRGPRRPSPLSTQQSGEAVATEHIAAKGGHRHREHSRRGRPARTARGGVSMSTWSHSHGEPWTKSFCDLAVG
jgi:hypothetical protein